jgi:hypothetical protein
MIDLFDTTQVYDDDGYWDALAQRVAAAAVRESRRSGFERFAYSRASWVAALLLLGAALAFMVLTVDDQSATRYVSEWTQALAPADNVGRAIVFRDGPPAIGALLLGDPIGGVR